MPDRKREPEIEAIEAIHAALKPLDELQRKRVLASVFALLGIDGTTLASAKPVPSRPNELPTATQPDDQTARAQARPLGITELVTNKGPGTNAQRITLFAYYKDKYEGTQRFGRADLETYFAKAKQPPPKNYDRDFVEAVKRGWIHEDGTESYITTKGIEMVESSFAGERKYTKDTRKVRRIHHGSDKHKVSRNRPRK